MRLSKRTWQVRFKYSDFSRKLTCEAEATPGTCGSGVPQLAEQRFEIRRKRRFEPDRSFVRGVTKRQPVGVQRLPRKRNRPQRIGSEGIALLADQRVAAKPRLQPDLIALAGVQTHLDERRRLERFQRRGSG